MAKFWKREVYLGRDLKGEKDMRSLINAVLVGATVTVALAFRTIPVEATVAGCVAAAGVILHYDLKNYYE